MKEFTTKGEKLLRNMRRTDFDVLDLLDYEERDKDINNLKEISEDDEEILNFLTYFKGCRRKKDLKELIDKIKNISDEDINTFQKFYDMDYNFNEEHFDDDNFYSSTRYFSRKYTDEELDFLISLTEDDLDIFEDDYDDFVDNNDFFEDELIEIYEEYCSHKEYLEYTDDEDSIYIESDFYDEDDLDDDNLDIFFKEIEDEKDEFEEEDEEIEFQSYATKDDYFQKTSHKENKYLNENKDSDKDIYKLISALIGLIGCLILLYFFKGLY